MGRSLDAAREFGFGETLRGRGFGAVQVAFAGLHIPTDAKRGFALASVLYNRGGSVS